MKPRHLTITILISIFIFGTYSCKKEFNKISTSDWKPEVAAPFIHTTIVLNDLFTNDTNLITQPDSSLIYIYYKDSVFNTSADTLLDIEDDIIKEQNFSLGELFMPSFALESEFTLYDILPFLDQNVRDSLIKYNGTENYFPPFQLLEEVTLESEAIEEYIELTFSRGKLFVDINNSLPVSILNIDFNVLDISNNYIIKNINIAELLPNEQYTDSIDITGLTLGNEFGFTINSFESGGSFPDKVYIDLNEGMMFGLDARNLRIISGKAKITEQIMYAETSWIEFPVAPKQLHNILFSEGIFTYNLNSELNVAINVSLNLPESEINNNIPGHDFELLAEGIVNEQWNISGMYTNLTAGPVKAYNQMPIEMEIVILPTDYIVEFDSSDKVNGFFAMEDLNIGYTDGYFGKQQINITNDTFNLNLDFLKRLEGELILQNPSMKIDYVNSIGVPMRIKTNFFGLNSKTGQSQYLEFDSIDVNIPGINGEWVTGEEMLDKTNSTIVDFLSIRPDKLIYFGGGFTNPDESMWNFVNNESKLIGNVELKIPLILRADHLSFSDTLGFSGSSEGFPLQEGLMQLNITNGFPFDLTMKMILVDSLSGNVLDQITFDDIASALVDGEGKVTESVLSEIIVEFDEEFLQNMRISNTAFLEVETSSFGNGEVPVVLYSDYKIDIAIGFLAKISP